MVHFVRCALLVEAEKDGQTEYWAAATHRDDAIVAVGTQTGPDWKLVLTERRLTGKEAAKLKMGHNSVRKLNAAPRGDAPHTATGESAIAWQLSDDAIFAR
jgi:hypothetical protein